MSYFDGIEFFLFLAIALIIGFIINYLGKKIEYYQIVDKKTKISMNVLMFWSFFKKNKPYG